MSLVFVVLILFFLAGSVLGWAAFLKLRSLTRQVDLLRRAVKSTVNRLDSWQPDSVASSQGLQESPVAPREGTQASRPSGSEPDDPSVDGYAGDVWSGPETTSTYVGGESPFR